jgi:hypothetical protein
MPIVEKNLDGFLAAFQAILRFEERPLAKLHTLCPALEIHRFAHDVP